MASSHLFSSSALVASSATASRTFVWASLRAAASLSKETFNVLSSVSTCASATPNASAFFAAACSRRLASSIRRWAPSTCFACAFRMDVARLSPELRWSSAFLRSSRPLASAGSAALTASLVALLSPPRSSIAWANAPLSSTARLISSTSSSGFSRFRNPPSVSRLSPRCCVAWLALSARSRPARMPLVASGM